MEPFQQYVYSVSIRSHITKMWIISRTHTYHYRNYRIRPTRIKHQTALHFCFVFWQTHTLRQIVRTTTRTTEISQFRWSTATTTTTTIYSILMITVAAASQSHNLKVFHELFIIHESAFSLFRLLLENPNWMSHMNMGLIVLIAADNIIEFR